MAKEQGNQELRDLFDDISVSSLESLIRGSECSDDDLEGREIDQEQDNLDGVFSDNDDSDKEYISDINKRMNNEDLQEEQQCSTEDDENETDENERYYNSQNKKFFRKWNTQPPRIHKVPDFQIARETSGLIGKAAHFSKEEACFKSILPPTLMRVITAETNRKARDYYDQLHNPTQHKRPRIWYDVEIEEMYAVIGILLYAGLRKIWDERLEELCHKENRPFYRASMSLQRIQQILRFMRFDNHRTRNERLKTDKLTSFRDVWLMFQENLKAGYRPGNLTVDEQLVATRGRCNFRQYIPSKPGKYGIKIFWIVDARSSYPLNGEIYIGCQPGEKSAKDFAFNLVYRLARPYVKKGRAITMDTFFTNCVLAKNMIRQKTSIIGTIIDAISLIYQSN